MLGTENGRLSMLGLFAQPATPFSQADLQQFVAFREPEALPLVLPDFVRKAFVVGNMRTSFTVANMRPSFKVANKRATFKV